MISILDIPDQYFLVWDKERHEAIKNSLDFITALKTGERQDTEENRIILGEQIKGVVGFRKAENLATGNLLPLEEILLEQNQRQHIEGLLERCAINQETFSQQFAQLAERLELNKEESKSLEDRLKKVVRGSTFRLARSIQELLYGRVDEKVLPLVYMATTRYIWFPLARELITSELKEHDVDHVHTHNARYSNMMLNYLNGYTSISTKVLNHIGIDDTSSWQSKSGDLSILDPIINPEPKTVGFYIGYFLFGHGSGTIQIKYSITNKNREWFLDLLEGVGVLYKDSSIVEMPIKDIYAYFGKENKSELNAKNYLVPKQFTSLAHYALELSRKQDDVELAKAALFGWLDDRSYTTGSGVSALLKPEYEGDIRRMTQLAGLELSGWWIKGNKKIVYTPNPEVIGYLPS